jgi:alkylation response protein AidB-like acyl-CoA dehydrogenase
MSVALLPALTDEQSMWLDSSVRLMDERMPMQLLRQRADGGSFNDREYRRAAAELGWFGLLAEGEEGAGGVSDNAVVDAALLAAERGARLQPGPFAGQSAVVQALSATRSRADVLRNLIEGTAWATWAGDSLGSCTATRDGNGFRLDGNSTDVIAEGAGCRWFLVSAEGPAGATQVLVEADSPGVTIRVLTGLDVTRTWITAEFDGATVDAASVVGQPGVATDAMIARQQQVASVLTAAESVGAMNTDFEIALQYAKDRIAFGRPIGSFQAVKHLLADTSLWIEMAKAIVAAAGTALGSNASDGPQLAYAAKAFVAPRGIELAHNCFQVFGGIGFTWEHDQHLYLRRLAADAQCFGSDAKHRELVLEAAGVA